MKDKLTALVVEGRITVNDLRTIENAFATVAEQASRIAELLELVGERNSRIAEIEHSAALVKTRGPQGARIAEQEAVIAALRRAHKTWSDKTDWVQDQNFGVIGDHRADAINAHIERQDARIAELEKQAAIDKTLLALADARINRELRDDFAGRAMQGLISSGGWIDAGQAADEAYVHADAMLKAKGGA